LTVTRIAHLSDVHMLPTRPGWARAYHDLSVRFLSLGRPVDEHDRVRKLRRGLAAAQRSGADHFVISGDLTEVGRTAEFETFAEVLHESQIDPDRVTLVPGNHDAYAAPDGWKQALAGPLAAFRRGAAEQPGKVVEARGVTFLPVDVACHQAITRSAGELTSEVAEALEGRMADPALAHQPMVLVQHHPPFAHASRAYQWIDGLRGWSRLMDLITRFSDVHVLHGHLHHVVDRIIGLGRSRIFGAPATVDDRTEIARVRIYDVRGGILESQGILEG